MSASDKIAALKAEIKRLQARIRELEQNNLVFNADKPMVDAPDEMAHLFDEATEKAHAYFSKFYASPEKATIEINNNRYVLMRADALSYELLKSFQTLYADRGEEEANSIGRNFLFDLSHMVGKEDAASFHKDMDLKDPSAKLSAGPVHFAFTGWAFVEILSDSNPSPDDEFFLHYIHHNSFEADSWIERNERSPKPVCAMNAGYSSGWCSESFGISLTAVEVTCRACGDEQCTFIMAPADRIQEIMDKQDVSNSSNYDIPTFLQRKKTEEDFQRSLKEKETLLREIHHRVKNNLQIVSSMLNLQSDLIESSDLRNIFQESRNRIRAMAILHEALYQSPDLSHINASDYVHAIVQSIKFSYPGDAYTVAFFTDTDPNIPQLSMEYTIPIGLIVNELVSNSLKHAFETSEKARIRISLQMEGNDLMLKVEDNGKGFPVLTDTEPRTLGFQIVDLLAEQLDGTVARNNAEGAQTVIRIPFIAD